MLALDDHFSERCLDSGFKTTEYLVKFAVRIILIAK